MSKLVLDPNPRGSQTPTIDTPPNEVRLPGEEARNINPNRFPEGTCTECQKITLHSLLETHLGSIKKCWLDYDRDLPTSCPICKLMFGSIHLGHEMTGKIRLELRVDDPEPNIDIYTGRRIHEVLLSKYREYNRGREFKGQFRIYAQPGSYASKFVPYWCAPSSNFSNTTFWKIARRVKNCDETHTSCRNFSAQSPELTSQYIPSRVVHVGSETHKPYLHIVHDQQSSRYVALSHCWGDVPQVETLKANIEQHKEAIVYESLSKTFQDALCVARRLGIDYIWIDSLCIVQDDEDDWLHESENMGSIYMNADITIAATSATDGNGGLDSVRPKSKWIEFPCDGTDEGKGHMWLTDASWSSQSDLNDAPLNLRGWVLQEKILSRRIIHFASSQVYWECKEGFLGEECEDPIRLPADATLKPSLFWAAVSRVGNTPIERANDIPFAAKPKPRLLGFYQSWRTFIHYYSTRNLTKKSDRLIALMGIIRVIERKTGLCCVDGHWDDGSRQFVHELMWSPKEQTTLSILDETRQSRLCSSWSWASLGAPVQFSTNFVDVWENYGLQDCSLQLQAIGGKELVPWASHPLEVSGMLRASNKGKLEVSEYLNRMYPGKRTLRVMSEAFKKVDGFVCFDCADEESGQFYLSPVYMSFSDIECLVLVEQSYAGSKARCFKRVSDSCVHEDEHIVTLKGKRVAELTYALLSLYGIANVKKEGQSSFRGIVGLDMVMHRGKCRVGSLSSGMFDWETTPEGHTQQSPASYTHNASY
ncbi:heterokaryon incompatibility protein-domain-containing protein [Alternaria rosae]|uniref:heterokaryon incompatibility protein-domain-containing protein n=1 Tax=Alternaria rosae TaxID=1187941 RepID=UPI001E8DE259|nr:heterokaryon incompatibility protein-domain-containing protein [Alternaria rosae]KAH6857407.1 heterokaryon incompatibility protein-domain-containing protein [Alternaria rosae]